MRARPTALSDSLAFIERELDGCAAPYAINLVCHRSNARLAADLEVISRRRAPIVVLALGASAEVVEAIHGYGGLVFNDVVSDRQARRCARDECRRNHRGLGGGGRAHRLGFALRADAGNSGMVARAASAGGLHRDGARGARRPDAGRRFRLYRLAVPRQHGSRHRACLQADGRREQRPGHHRDQRFHGGRASFLAPSLRANGLDPEAIAREHKDGVDISGAASQGRAWRDIWSAGQGIGAVKASLPAGAWIAGLAAEYEAAKIAMGMRP